MNKSSNWHTLNARKHPTRTVDEDRILLKRSDEESDEDKDESTSTSHPSNSKVAIPSGQLAPTRTRKLSYEPEKVIDFKVNPE